MTRGACSACGCAPHECECHDRAFPLALPEPTREPSRPVLVRGLTESQLRALDERATALRVSRSEIIRRLIATYTRHVT